MKHFIFFNEENNGHIVKSKARDLKSTNPIINLSDALDTVSRSINAGLSYNEAVTKAKPTSPFTVLASEDSLLTSDTLFLPLELTTTKHDIEEDVIYYVPVTNITAALSKNSNIELMEDDTFVKSLQYRNLEKIDRDGVIGWVVNIFQPQSNVLMASIELKATYEGLFLELWSESLGEFIDSTSAPYNELLEVYSFNDITHGAGRISTYEACVEIGHDDDSSNLLLIAGGLELTISNSWEVSDANGNTITPQTINSNVVADKKALMMWLQGRYDENFDKFRCTVSPWFLVTFNSKPMGDPLDFIPRNLNECMYFISKQFIE